MPEPHKDRRAGLIAFGVLHVLLGCFTLLLLLRAASSQLYVAQSLFFYSVATCYFVATGIGSIRGRRTARALIAAVSGAWTVVGAVALVVLFTVRPVPAAKEIAVSAILMVALPLVLTLFYSSRDTALTADELDPRVRWTDRAPVPVLAICSVLAFSAIETLINAGREPVAFFGSRLTGASAALAMIAIAILFLYVAVQAYRLREYAWWVLLLLQVIGGLSSAITLAQITHQPATWAVAGAGWIALLCFLIWVRRYFVALAAT